MNPIYLVRNGIAHTTLSGHLLSYAACVVRTCTHLARTSLSLSLHRCGRCIESSRGDVSHTGHHTVRIFVTITPLCRLTLTPFATPHFRRIPSLLFTALHAHNVFRHVFASFIFAATCDVSRIFISRLFIHSMSVFCMSNRCDQTILYV